MSWTAWSPRFYSTVHGRSQETQDSWVEDRRWSLLIAVAIVYTLLLACRSPNSHREINKGDTDTCDGLFFKNNNSRTKELESFIMRNYHVFPFIQMKTSSGQKITCYKNTPEKNGLEYRYSEPLLRMCTGRNNPWWTAPQQLQLDYTCVSCGFI